MREKEIQILLVCLSGDDSELAHYAEKRLLKHDKHNYKLVHEKKGTSHRIEDHDLYELYNSEDPFLSMKARELTVKYHTRYLYYIMGKYFGGYEKEYSEDLYQCGVVGLLKSLIHYDGRYAISTYSRLYIIHEMTGFIYYLKNIPSPHYARIQNKIKAAETFLECSGADISDEAIAKEINISLKSVQQERLAMKVAAPVYIDAYSPDALEKIFGAENVVENFVIKKLNQENIRMAIEKLPADYQLVLQMKIVEEYSFQEIADIFGVEKKKVYKKYYAALRHVKQRLKNTVISRH